MSYASVAATNAPPLSAQPHPDQGLLNTEPEHAPSVLNDTGPKVNVVESTFKEHPATTTSVNRPPSDEVRERERFKSKAKKDIYRAEEEGAAFWEYIKERLLRPGVAGGLLGVVNVGLLGTFGYNLYTEPHLRSDRRFLGWSTLGALAFLGAEGFLAEAYRNTDAGREEERKARKEGAVLYKHTKEVVLRPKVFGGLLGVLNVGIIGAVSYIAYDNWNRPWDRRTVSAITVGLLSLFTGEGYVAEKYRQEEYPKRR
ncbi:hypothetical protein M422DRAFT_27764 [Sphaerobolus stellatus SS14]|nr:hypothetical protein M422DRAFT_27764 [Sphaerobolus stellatus SS14]